MCQIPKRNWHQTPPPPHYLPGYMDLKKKQNSMSGYMHLKKKQNSMYPGTRVHGFDEKTKFHESENKKLFFDNEGVGWRQFYFLNLTHFFDI